MVPPEEGESRNVRIVDGKTQLANKKRWSASYITSKHRAISQFYSAIIPFLCVWP